MNARLTLLRIFPVLALLLSAVAPVVSAQIQIRSIGDLPGGGVGSFVWGVSADGLTAVGASNENDYFRPVRWTDAGGLLALAGGVDTGFAFGASQNGAVVVGTNNSQAFRWSSGGGLVSLGALPGGFSSEALGVSADGTVVVGYSSSASGTQAFRWTAGDGLEALGDLAGGNFESIAYRVSADGSVVVGFGNSASGREAMRWTAGGGMVGLGDLPGGDFHSQAWSASADGSVVVGEGSSASGREAFLWTAGGGMVGLGDLPGDVFQSTARDVSADGSVVVGSSAQASRGETAMYWTAATGMVSLWDYLVEQGVDLSGWNSLGIATGVSAAGDVIVGIGVYQGNSAGFVVSGLSLAAPPPPPAQVVFHAIGDLPGGIHYSEIRDAVRAPGGIVGVGGGTRLSFSASSDTAVKWTPAGGFEILPPLVVPTSSHVFITASAVSANGQVIAARSRASTGFPPERMAVIYSGASLARTNLGYLPNAIFVSSAVAMSADGGVVYGFAGYNLNPTPAGMMAFRWTAGEGMTPLGFLFPGDVDSTPAGRGASADGRVLVGSSHATPAAPRAYRYEHGVGMGALPLPAGGTWSAAEAVSADGSVVLVRGNSAAEPNGELFYWSAFGGLQALGKPAGTLGVSNFAAFTGDYQVVFGTFSTTAQPGVFRSYFRNPFGWHLLRDALADAGIDVSGYPTMVAFGCAGDGTLVFGYGTRLLGGREGFIAEFPAGYLANYRSDRVAPVLTVPDDIEAEATSAAGAVVNFAATAVDDVDGPVPVLYSQDPGTIFPLGTTVVNVSATDGSNNIASGRFTVTVSDTTAPVFSGVTATPSMLWPVNQKLVAVTVGASVTDAVDAAATWRIVGVTCNEPAAGDWQITAPNTVLLRATRSGSGQGRVYTLTLEATDAAGNSATATHLVLVPHDQRHR